MDQIYIKKKLQEIRVLSTFPDVVKKIIAIMEDPLSSASDLKRYIDPSISSEILRVANSAYFGSRNFRKINTIEHAIAIIGFEHLSYIILQMPFISLIRSKDKIFKKDEYIEHALATACLSKTVSEILHVAQPQEVYVAGMLHDIGIIILYSHFQKEWEAIVSQIEDKGISRLEAEKKILSFDHGFIGGLLLYMWNLPLSVAEGIMFHHDPSGARDFKEYAEVINIGNILAKKLKIQEWMLSFDDFFKEYQYVLKPLWNKVENVGDEMLIMERIYLQLKKVKDNMMVLGKNDDKSSHS